MLGQNVLRGFANHGQPGTQLIVALRLMERFQQFALLDAHELSRFVERFGAKNTKASQAQSKRKQIARLKAERVVIPRKAQGIRFQFPDPPHAGRTLVRLKDAVWAFDVLHYLYNDLHLLLIGTGSHERPLKAFAWEVGVGPLECSI